MLRNHFFPASIIGYNRTSVFFFFLRRTPALSGLTSPTFQTMNSSLPSPWSPPCVPSNTRTTATFSAWASRRRASRAKRAVMNKMASPSCSTRFNFLKPRVKQKMRKAELVLVCFAEKESKHSTKEKKKKKKKGKEVKRNKRPCFVFMWQQKISTEYKKTIKNNKENCFMHV